MSIDLAGVDWTFLGLMTALAFVAALLGSLIAFRNRFFGAILAAILFAVGFLGWNYYPHNFGLPILKTTGPDGTMVPAVTTAPPAASTPMSSTPMAPSPVSPVSPAPSGPASPMAPTSPGSGSNH